MPELPEVETTRRGISPLILGQTIQHIDVRQTQLRQPVPKDIDVKCSGKKVLQITRRAKYLLLHLTEGYILIHLGMSGHLHLARQKTGIQKHDHIDMVFKNGIRLRYHDPRRFGLWLYIDEHPYKHKLLASLGKEPLSDEFDATYLFQLAQGKKQSIKSFMMSNKVVVGIGNIYATESLYWANIHPITAAGQINKEQYDQLVTQIKCILQHAIDAGGTTLKDFLSLNGKPGYFASELQVYGRAGRKCNRCHTLIQTIRIAGRSTAFCPTCQPLYYK